MLDRARMWRGIEKEVSGSEQVITVLKTASVEGGIVRDETQTKQLY